MDFLALLLIPLVLALVWGTKQVLTTLPRVAMPILAVGYGVGSTYLAAHVGLVTFTPMEAGLLGAAATWLRELVHTAQQHGTKA